MIASKAEAIAHAEQLASQHQNEEWAVYQCSALWYGGPEEDDVFEVFPASSEAFLNASWKRVYTTAPRQLM